MVLKAHARDSIAEQHLTLLVNLQVSSFGSHLGDEEEVVMQQDKPEASASGEEGVSRFAWGRGGAHLPLSRHPDQYSLAFMQQLRQHNLKIRRRRILSTPFLPPIEVFMKALSCRASSMHAFCHSLSLSLCLFLSLTHTHIFSILRIDGWMHRCIDRQRVRVKKNSTGRSQRE